VGAIVEELTVREERQAFCNKGVMQMFSIFPVSKKGLSRIRMVAPSELELKVRVWGSELTPTSSTQDGKTVYVVESRSTEPWAIEPFAPRNTIQIPTVVAVTGKSWAEICTYYWQRIRERIDPQGVAPVVEQILDAADDRETRIEKLVSYVQRTVRYTGLEFGEASILPAAPRAHSAACWV
jgi:hypothetical protein